MEFLIFLLAPACGLGGYVLSTRAPRAHRWILSFFYDDERIERMGA